MTRTRRSTRPRAVALAAILAGFAATAGCVQRSGGTWMIRSARTPADWPEPTPVGRVEVKEYPTYRAAQVSADDLQAEGRRSMFMELFRHIQRNDIAMTAPVEMSYAEGRPESPRMSSMAFLYRSPDLGPTGSEGAVRVHDVAPTTFASVGLRGSYTEKNFRRGLAVLEEWLAAHGDEWEPAGEPRYLGYNSPFVLPFLRFGEVQVPVRRRSAPTEG